MNRKQKWVALLLVLSILLPTLAMAEYFPLKDPLELNITYLSTTYDADDLSQRAIVKRYEDETNIHFGFQIVNAEVGEDYVSKLRVLVAAQDYGDIIERCTAAYVTELALSGVAVDISPYITEEIMPNLCKALQKHPNLLRSVTEADGKIYALPMLDERPTTENFFIINKQWLDNLGLEAPTTMDEFYNVLLAFKENDANGNGDPNDEIPFEMVDQYSMGANFEAFMSSYGLAYKHTPDKYMAQVNGEAVFCPTTENYKDGLKILHKMYQDGLLERECFTMKESDFLAKCKSATSIVGCTYYKNTTIFGRPEEYSIIQPPVADGYEVKVWRNTANVNGKNSGWVITNKNKNVEATLAWIDRAYDPAEYMYNLYGDCVYVNEQGVTCVNETDIPAEYEDSQKWIEATNLSLNNWPGLISYDSLYTDVILPQSSMSATEIGKAYVESGAFTTEVWPRPTMTEDETIEYTELKTPIWEYLRSFKATAITDSACDIDQAWNAYVEMLTSMGLNRYIEIQQGALNRYNGVK